MKTVMNQNQPGMHPSDITPRHSAVTLSLVIFIFVLLQGCTKDNCENPCLDGCGVCPEICKTNPCGNPEECPGLCPSFTDGVIGKGNLKGTGDVTETANGLTVDGALTISTPDADIVLNDAEITVEYNDDGTVKSMEGKAEVPSPADYMEITKPVQADLGYYSGKYLNDNWDLEIRLVDDRFYLAFKIAVALEMKVGAKSDPDATKPLTIKPPVGGHIIYIFDFMDPFYFYSAAQDILGSMCFGESIQGNIPYTPLQPVDDIISFEGQSVRCGTFPIFKVVEVTGTMIQAQGFNVELVEEDPFPLSFSAGYSAGVNGEFELSLPINNWITFAIPLGEASAAITAEAGTAGVKARAFINGLAKPDNSWWPDFIPVKPGGQVRASGYVQQSGQFDLELSGAFNLELPGNNYELEGSLGADNEAFTMTGSVLASNMKWAAGAEFRKGETEFKAKPPQELLDDINNLVNSNIDSAINKAETALADLEKATADYEFELSLRGFREVIPAIVKEAKSRIAKEIDAGIKSGKAQANKIVKDKGGVLCSDNISPVVKKLDDPYIKALDRLNNAVKPANDNATTRKEIEGALRDLAKLNRLKKSVAVTIKVGNKVTKCLVTTTHKRTVSIDVQVLTSEQVNMLNEAADNVKYIAETNDIMIEAQEIFDRVPAKEVMEKLRDDIATGVKAIPSIEEVGFINYHDKNTFSYYWIVDGKKTDLSDINIFDPDAISEAIIDGLL